jgi:hypothetical protein
MLFLIYAYDNICLYWMENELFLFIYLFILGVAGARGPRDHLPLVQPGGGLCAHAGPTPPPPGLHQPARGSRPGTRPLLQHHPTTLQPRRH